MPAGERRMSCRLLGWSVALSMLSLLACAAPSRAQAAVDPTVPGQPGLALGITESNPNFLWPAEDRALPEPFAAWRTEFQAVRPQIYRLVLDWARLQREPTAPADLGQPADGCMRGAPPRPGRDGRGRAPRAPCAPQRP